MFWKFNLITTSHIETLLNKENVTLKELMDEDDILQECKAQTKKLLDFLSRSEIMDEMVTLIIQEPPEDLDEKSRYKYPNIACEILTVDVTQINDALSSDESLLNKLYSFLDTEKPLNPLLASFFSKIIGLLISRKTDAIFEFLKNKEDFVSLVLNHIETSAIMDLLLRLVTCIESNDIRCSVVKWLDDQKVVQRLIGLINPNFTEERNGNAAQALCDIIKVSREHMSLLQEKAEPDPLLKTIESIDTLSELLNHMFNGEKRECVLVSGISVFLSLLEFKRQGPAGQQQIPQNQVQPPLQGEGAPHCFTSVFFRNDVPDQMTSLDAERLEQGVENVMSALTPHLNSFHQLLLVPPPKSAITTTVGTLDPPVGFTRLEVAHLLTALLSTNTHSVNLQLVKLGTIGVLLDLFFTYTWNNFLHTQVEQSIGRILTNKPTADEEGNKVHPLLDQVFNEYKLVQRVLDVWEENEQEQTKPGKHRRGYMGHLTKIANHIAQNAENGINSDLIKSKIKDLPEDYRNRWETFVSEVLSEINKKNQTPLVGGIPLPSNAAEFDDECVDLREIPFLQESAMKKAFSDYQMQQMTSNFVDQFGFHDDEFIDTDENMTNQLNHLTDTGFQLNSDENLRSEELFERACRERVQNLGDADSDEDVWEDKEHEVTFVSGSVSQQRSAENSDENSSGSEDDEHKTSSAAKTTTNISQLPAEEVKMDVDQQEMWTASFDSVPMEVAPASTSSNPWETPNPSISTEDQGGWADFSDFDAFGSVECPNQFSPCVVMETSYSTTASEKCEKYEISSEASEASADIDLQLTNTSSLTETTKRSSYNTKKQVGESNSQEEENISLNENSGTGSRSVFLANTRLMEDEKTSGTNSFTQENRPAAAAAPPPPAAPAPTSCNENKVKVDSVTNCPQNEEKCKSEQHSSDVVQNGPV
ncbi:serine/threonine-protein phosphatase 6 regulatory subunit 3 isoform X2 [Centruroides vittatus]|uniref:serine/threonine-protein phosphatase 6 regulatory subunit 3 isoform X2 n=1 Tax=Centruroides vittatus TaxID=120091 RepID=UPI0035104FF3